MRPKLFITGATGTIGSQIVHQLQNENIDFTAGLNEAPEAGLPYDYALINYADQSSLESAFQGITTLFLLFPVADDLMVYASNAIQAAQKAGVKHIVRSGAAGASLNSPYPIIRLHGQIDKLLEDSGIHFTIIQPYSFMQNFVSFLAYSIQQGTVYTSNPDSKIAFVDARDIAAVSVAVLGHPTAYQNQKIEISGREALTVSEGLNQISAAIDKRINLVQISHRQAHANLVQYGASDYVAQLIGSVELAAEEGAMAMVRDGVQKVLGRPPIGFDQFVQDHLAAWQ